MWVEIISTFLYIQRATEEKVRYKSYLIFTMIEFVSIHTIGFCSIFNSWISFFYSFRYKHKRKVEIKEFVTWAILILLECNSIYFHVEQLVVLLRSLVALNYSLLVDLGTN